MRAGEVVVMNRYPLLLSEQRKKIIGEKWENEVNKQNLPVPKRFNELVRYILSHCDMQGVLFGTVDELANSVNMTRHEARKSLQAMEKAELLQRKNGITMITDKYVRAHYL